MGPTERLVTPRRHPPEGGYARGEETRARIIAAALKVFGEEGYARASTRRIAAEAGVNPPALQYYFDGKDGLHRACGELMAARFAERLAEPMAAADQVLAKDEPAVAPDALADLIFAVFAMSANAGEQAQPFRRFIGRSQADGAGPAVAIVRESVKPLQKMVVALAARAMGVGPDDEQARLTAILLMAQLSAFQITRENTLAAMGWRDLHGPRAEMVRQTLRRIVRGALAASRP